ncbi:MAG: hypothetical protein RLZZ156_1454, partial [Deinococcota bacterium]
MNLDILENSVQDVQKATKSGLLFMGITMIADGLTLISYPPSMDVDSSDAFASAFMTEVNNALRMSEVGEAEYLITETESNMVGVIIVEQVLCWSTVFNMKEISLGL